MLSRLNGRAGIVGQQAIDGEMTEFFVLRQRFTGALEELLIVLVDDPR